MSFLRRTGRGAARHRDWDGVQRAVGLHGSPYTAVPISPSLAGCHFCTGERVRMQVPHTCPCDPQEIAACSERMLAELTVIR